LATRPGAALARRQADRSLCGRSRASHASLKSRAKPRRRIRDSDDPAEAITISAKTASHDLIDQKGRRFLQLRELTIRVGDWVLEVPSKRPKDPSTAGGLRLEGKGGAFIQIDKDGNITIETPETLSLKGAKGITLEGPGVTATLKSSKMNVE